MLHLGTNRERRTRTLVLALVLTLSTTMMVGETATTALATTSSSTTAASARTVAHTDQGRLRSRIVGTTGNDRAVTGSFVPLAFVKHHGTVKVRGLVDGVVHNADGSTRTFSVLRTVRVVSIDGVDLARGPAAASRGLFDCDVLHLVLGPLDLDLLGLRVHLDRIVLDVVAVAVAGAGNLVGNLVCAVAHLLDGGLVGVLAELVILLNQILALLGLGL